MSCYHPLKGFKIGVNPSGKPKYMITPFDVKFVRKYNGVWRYCYDWSTDDKYHTEDIVTDSVKIPCGKCIGCRLDYSRQWADRCMLEAKYYSANSFITLTYNDDNLPPCNPVYDLETGEEIGVSNVHPLVKKDFQDFMKRLRDRIGYDNPIRFYACGEYGSKNYRPHYHAIIFNYDFSDDRRLLKQNYQGDNYYVSDFLDSCWQKGFSMVTDVDWNCCAYVARYVAKKVFKENDLYEKNNIPREFTLMSRKPGIGRQYYDDNKLYILEYQRIPIGDSKGVKILRPPKYYDKLFDADKELMYKMDEVRQKRLQYSEYSDNLKLKQSSKDMLGILEDAEINMLARTKILKERSKTE